MPLNLYTSNRMEVLVAALGDTLGKPLTSALQSEMIVLQSRGMQRWLSMELASRFGVWANGHYPFPNAMVTGLFECMQLDQPDSSSFSKEVMTWKIIRLLGEMTELEVFRPLQTYLADDRNGLKCFQLAGKIADTFDQYTLFRSDLLAGWEVMEDSGAGEWQAVLWRKLVDEASGKHRGSLKDEFCRKIRSRQGHVARFPERIAFFGISSLPGFYLEMLSAVSEIVDVNLFILSPTKEYWGDIVSRRRVAGMPAAEKALHTEGNPLLASLGTIGRDFSGMVLELNDDAVVEEELYVDPGEDSLLHLVQSDMLNLADAGSDGVRRKVDAVDRSVQIHSCHSPLREIEVLHDNLLFMLDELPGLKPRDILVMLTDVEAYSSYISTVFGRSGEGVPALPYTIADRTFLNEGEIASSMLKLLDIEGSRMTAPQLFDLLSTPPVSRRFNLEESGLETIREWIEETNIRWGINESDREARDLPAYRENSWRAGLDRLLLGCAMPESGELFAGILPCEDMEGGVIELLGILAGFIDSIERLAIRIRSARTLEEWQEFFLAMLNEFIKADEESERELAAIHGVVNTISDFGPKSRFTGEVQPAVMLSWMRMNLEQEEHGLGFMTGAITFCSMLPMRSIPFRVIAMLGMNDGAFPRQDRSPGFDLIAREPRRGDRSKRSEDRYLFLETLLSARDRLYLSYVGQSVRDNSEIPPSVLISELLDAIERGFLFSGNERAEKRLVVRHRLQAFNAAYFTKGSPLFSYSRENFQALAGFASAGSSSVPFIDEPIEVLSEEHKTVSLDRLIRFYDNPAAFFLSERLGIRFGGSIKPLEEREPFSVGGLDGYYMKQELLDEELQGGNPERLLPIFRARGLLPPARNGEMVFRKMVDEVKAFGGVVRQKTGGGAPLAPLNAELQLGTFRLTGSLERLSASCRMQVRCASMKPRDQIRSWIEHLVLNVIAPEGYPHESVLVMQDKAKRYRSVQDAPLLLERVLDYFWEGQREPLPFFPGASLAWAGKYGEDDAIRFEAADTAWSAGYLSSGEGADPAIQRCFGSEPPFTDRFGTIADELLLPMLASGERA